MSGLDETLECTQGPIGKLRGVRLRRALKLSGDLMLSGPNHIQSHVMHCRLQSTSLMVMATQGTLPETQESEGSEWQ